MLRFALFSAILLSSAVRLADSHGDHGEEAGRSCEMSPNVRVLAEYLPGVITVDGHADDWDDVDGSEFTLLPALDPDEDKAYAGGQMTVKAVHDGSNVFFMLQVDGEFAFSKGENTRCPSVALMFQVGEDASYHNMGGCTDMPGTCTNKSCHGHEVDIMHFSIGNAIPGRLYGGNLVDNSDGNGNDRFGHLVDVYAWNPHCRYLDGKGLGNGSNAQNDWHGTWWHSSLTSLSVLLYMKDGFDYIPSKSAHILPGYLEEDSPYGKSDQKGTYIFEFSRPLRTMDRFQQDVQFTISQASKMAVAFWYPISGNPWSGPQHYSASCNWLPLDIASPNGPSVSKVRSGSSWDAATAFALLLSVVSFCLSVFIGYWVSRNKAVPFTPIDHL